MDCKFYVINVGQLYFVITSSPTNSNIGKFISYITLNDITNMVCACKEIEYNQTIINSVCTVTNLPFDDGSCPDDIQIRDYLNIINNSRNKKFIIHCKAGLGRAPLLAAIAVIICEKKDPYDTIESIRKIIKNCFNNKQIIFLTKTDWSKYRKYYKKINKTDTSNNFCYIM